ncbi:MAG: NAD-dependent epimerase/dehydratase family protein [Chloroflexi bacterium]|nr:NAD-dependent epimerase/dehydratase family protein [Chloroflexota bacterium]
MSSAGRQSFVVLGHTGFLGRAVVDQLSRDGHRVQGFGSSQVDLRRRDSLAALDAAVSPTSTVIVASALTPNKGQTIATLSDNFAMMANLADYLTANPPGRCVYISSDAVYPMGDQTVTETSAVEPSNIYALAKYNGEIILQSAASTGGFPLLVLRPTGVYGPGDTHNSYGPNRFVRTIAQDRTVKLFGAGEETRDHLFLDDAARLIALLSASNTTGVFNLATGSSRSFGSIVEDLRSLAPFEFELVQAPRGGPVTHRQFNVAKLQQAVPDFIFTPWQQGLETSLRAALDRQPAAP